MRGDRPGARRGDRRVVRATTTTARLVDELRALGLRFEADEGDRPKEGPLTGRQYAITGTLEAMTREEAAAALEALGAKVSDSVSKKTTGVIVGESPGSKIAKAETAGVPMLDEAELRAARRRLASAALDGERRRDAVLRLCAPRSSATGWPFSIVTNAKRRADVARERGGDVRRAGLAAHEPVVRRVEQAVLQRAGAGRRPGARPRRSARIAGRSTSSRGASRARAPVTRSSRERPGAVGDPHARERDARGREVAPRRPPRRRPSCRAPPASEPIAFSTISAVKLSLSVVHDREDLRTAARSRSSRAVRAVGRAPGADAPRA